jgi:hypothetical protein
MVVIIRFTQCSISVSLFQGWCRGSLIYSCFFCVLNRLVSRVIKHKFCCTLLFHNFLFLCYSFMTYKGVFAF